MNAVLKMTDEAPRLYSKQQRVPADVVAPQHIEIHADLERWGQWNRDRYEPGTCASAEKKYDNTGGRETKKATVALPQNPQLRLIDRTLRHMAMRVPPHAECLKLFYVKRSTPFVICRALVIRWEDFPTWMFDCRAMVINVMKQIS